MHICTDKLVIIASGNGLLPVEHQAITCTDTEIVSVGHVVTNIREIWIKNIFIKKELI